MCGIVGFSGKGDAPNILLEGLRRLEYRGYDSAGIAVIDDNGEIKRTRCEGKISKLTRILSENPLEGETAIGHTRWATHGRPSDENAHPHTDCSRKLVVVHNGIIENYSKLKHKLIDEGHKFTSETDTEVIAHLIESQLESSDDLLSAVFSTLKILEGSYALGIISADSPGQIIAARKDSPLILGVSDEGNFIASDVPAVLPYTNKVIYIEDGDIIQLTKEQVRMFNSNHEEIKRPVTTIDWNPVMAEKQGYKHFMLKEIYEQQQAIQETLSGRLDLDTGDVVLEDFNFDEEYLKNITRIFIVACGTAYHAGLVGKFLLEDRLKIPCEVDIASEFRYRKPPIDENTMIISISQSGETADTLAATRQAKKCNAKTAVICNVRGSSATREADGIIYTHAGPEIGVASTKAFTSQLTALYLLTLYLGKIRNMISADEAMEIGSNLVRLPLMVHHILQKQKENILQIAHKYFRKKDFLYLGRNINYPIALEGALKLKEISYIHAEGYPAGEMKHGPIALIDEEMPVVVIATESAVYEKVLANMEEARARDGKIIALATVGDNQIKHFADDLIIIPKTLEILYPLLNTIPLQLLAYYIATLRGCDVDQPRNLAKSVTVE
ncbi:glutamine--fructose-6-phosphate transaminase (isomerizing) [Elusimicrobiota bacterium]